MLNNLSVAFGRPWFLVLFPLVLPPLVLFSYKSLSGLGKVRRFVAIAFRATVVSLIVLALAELQSVRTTERLTTMFLLDVSESIPRDKQVEAMQFVTEASKKRRKDDLSAVVVFGRNPLVESPPAPVESNLSMGIESLVDRQYTDIGAAMKLALATFPEDTARRIVLISDGNENRGNLIEQATAAQKLGVQVDVVPIEYFYDQEVLVERVNLPPDVKKGETVNIGVVVRASGASKGTLQIFQKADNYRAPAPGNEQPVPVDLKRGINVFNLKQKILEPNFYTFTAEFIPDKDSGDRRSINNKADGFVRARGTAQVLLIEGVRGEHNELVRALREKNLEVTTLTAPRIDGGGGVGGDNLPEDLAQLQPYDTVILGNVPKEAFTENQQKILETNVHDMGAGLVMLGGPDSFGAGGWMNSPIEKALPVDMQIKSIKAQGKSAMVLIMHATEIPEGNYWMKVIAQEALKTLSSYDYAGMLHWEGQEAWLFTLQPIGQGKARMLRAIDRMTPGDMPSFEGIINKALAGMRTVPDAMTKHMIIISDGDPAPPTRTTINQLIAAKITVTTVLTAAHGNDPGSLSTMRDIANKTKGRFYNVTNPKALPRIYQKEARIISRPLIFEQTPGWSPKLNFSSEPVAGLDSALPPILGMVLTSPKENELVELPITSPLPSGQVNPILAHWSYGLGKSVAFTSDAGARWTTAWKDWGSYAAFWSQVIRWSMRPVDRGNLALSVRREEGRIKVVVDALDKNNQFLNFLRVQGAVIDPDLKPRTVELAQTAPGRYEATIEGAEQSGNYFVNLAYVGPDGVQGVVSSGLSVPYSDEYRELKSNPATLETVASLTNGEVVAWKQRANNGGTDMPRTLAGHDAFRRDKFLMNPKTFTDMWPNLLWLAAVLFLADVAVRRVSPDVDRMKKSIVNAWKSMQGQEVAPSVDYMEKLKGRKAEVGDQIERTRTATRFEPPPAALLTEENLVDEPLLNPSVTSTSQPRPKPENRAGGLSVDPKTAAPESYTNRLLKAKQKVWEDRDNKKGPGEA